MDPGYGGSEPRPIDIEPPKLVLGGSSDRALGLARHSASRAPRWRGSGGVLPQDSDHTGSAWSSCGRPGRRTSWRPSSVTPWPKASPPRSSWPKRAAAPVLHRLPMLSEVAEGCGHDGIGPRSAMTGVMANVTCGFWVDV